jgi:EAL domain-containing protein (putative c-di-GMP-specific phosphodiesterase class I)
LLEVEEVIGEQDAAIADLQALRHAGVRIALDGFGGGSASLRCLTRLPVDVVKVDARFMSELAVSAKGAAVLDAVLRLIEAMQVEIVTDGSERQAERWHPSGAGRRPVRVNRLAEPMTAGALDELIRQDAGRGAAAGGSVLLPAGANMVDDPTV